MKEIAQATILVTIYLMAYFTGKRHGFMNGYDKGMQKMREIIDKTKNAVPK